MGSDCFGVWWPGVQKLKEQNAQSLVRHVKSGKCQGEQSGLETKRVCWMKQADRKT